MNKLDAMDVFLRALKVMRKYDHDFPPIVHRDVYFCFWSMKVSNQFNNPTFDLLNERIMDRVYECNLSRPPKLSREEWYTLAEDLLGKL
ncbi:hypothetical protein NVP1063O_036 [Vibrio phage 1.063.O._10N.261.45.C7]|nr:hypothetical protein NVP1063O_036 [Vibrio phage 1.063.O._10N.261.45.C7]